jgi:hypothetical protein
MSFLQTVVGVIGLHGLHAVRLVAGELGLKRDHARIPSHHHTDKIV